LKRAIVSVINDLVTDRRVDKTCNVLVQAGFDVLLVGRKLPDSLPLPQRAYQMHRMGLLFKRGPLFYMEFNIRLFFLLLFKKVELLYSNDLDTLLPNYLLSRMKSVPLVYDSHEFFTETPELVNRKFVQGIWKRIEKAIFPKLKDVITVNVSIADLYYDLYGVKVNVVRNISLAPVYESIKSREELGLPENIPIILLQGAGINIQRGAEEAIEAMRYLDNVILLIIGSGDVIDILKHMKDEMGLGDKVIFLPKMPFDRLFHYTANATLGLTLDKDTNINYRFSLPNKLFDYVNAGTPVLASPLVEVKKIIDKYQVGETIENHDPKHITKRITEMISDNEKLKVYRQNCHKASEKDHSGYR
jgi:glycosyltransferase involved in cell wall biosynthesis